MIRANRRRRFAKESTTRPNTRFRVVFERYLDSIAKIDDEYLRERTTDVRDAAQRLLENLNGCVGPALSMFPTTQCLVAQDLSPADLSMLRRRISSRASSLATGGVTSHASILAKSFEIPTVSGDRGIDGVRSSGRYADHRWQRRRMSSMSIRSPEVIREYNRLERALVPKLNRELGETQQLARRNRPMAAASALYANIGLLSDVGSLPNSTAPKASVFTAPRFRFLSHRDFPSEEEQYSLYKPRRRGLWPADR